jgi:hypothetical protein
VATSTRMTSPPGSITPVMGAHVMKTAGNEKELGSSMAEMYHPRTEGLTLAEVRSAQRFSNSAAPFPAA